jgi:hypothetical protein
MTLRRLASAAVVLLVALTVAPSFAAEPLQVVSAGPRGPLKGPEQQRIQIVFSAAVVPLGEVKPLAGPPPWLKLEPQISARWRWAGTTELVGEPLAPLPRATAYRVTVDATVAALDGGALAAPFTFTFSTPFPEATIYRVERDEKNDGESEEEAAERRRWRERNGPPTEDFIVVVRFNQPVDVASLAERLDVRIVPRPIEDVSSVAALPSEQWRRSDPAAYEAWQRFLAAAGGAPAGPASYVLESDSQHPAQIFRLDPLGCWPRGAALEVTVGEGVQALEGPATLARAAHASFSTPAPFAPLRFAGRALPAGGFDPDTVQLLFSTPVAWRDLAPFVRVQVAGGTKWGRLTPQPEAWYWGWQNAKLRLEPFGFDGGTSYEVCVDRGATDALGAELGFDWCGTLRTGHRTPAFYLVEGDGVVEWDGPHLLPLKSLNVSSYRLLQRRVTEEELAAVLGRHERAEATTLAAAPPVKTAGKPDRSVLLPVNLDPALGGKPGIVETRLQAVDALPGSEYEERESTWLRKPRTALTQVTALGLTVKASRRDGLLIWVTQLKQAQPATGAQIVVRDKDGAVLWRGESDARGLARTGPEASLDRAFVVTARVGEDLAYARTRWYEGHMGWEFNLPVDHSPSLPVTGVVWTDRGVVRPGESLHVKAVLRRQEARSLRLPQALKVALVVRNARGEDAVVRDLALDRWGAGETEITVPASAPLGRWTVLVGAAYARDRRTFTEPGAVTVPEEAWRSAWTVEGSFRVAEFRRPKFRVQVDTGAERLIAGDALSAHVEGSFLAGGAMRGAPAHWTVRVTPRTWRPAARKWDGFEFLPDAFAEEFDREALTTVAEGQGALDATGRLEVRVARVNAIKGWPARLEVEGEVQDVDRQSSAATANVDVLPGEFMLGVKRPPFFAEASAGVDAEVIALAPDGVARAGVAVTVQLVRRHWESVRRREVSGRYVFESQAVITPLAEQTITTVSDPVKVHFAVSEGGEHALVVRAPDARGNQASASASFYVFGSGYAAWRFDQENRIDLVPERERYAPGETARLLVKSPWERATALVTVERAGVLDATVKELVGTMPMLEIPVLAEYGPNVFVSVVLLRGRIEAAPDPEMIDPGRPAYRVGYCELTVPPKGKRLLVVARPAKDEYRPAQTAHVDVQVKSESGAPARASVTVWAVDAGVLALTRYATPDLYATFFARRGLGVVTAESRSRLVGRRSYGSKGEKSGGGGGRELAGEQLRSDFRALAVWRGDVVTDDQGRAALDFPLPDSLTTYRLMAVAVAGDEEFGAGEVEFRVTKPLGLEPALPRFMRPGDSARAGAVVRNRTKTTQEVEVTLTTGVGSPLRLRGGAARTVKVQPGASAEVGFGLIAERPGRATLRFDAVASGRNGERDAMQVTLPVLALQPSESVATFFATDARATEAVAVPKDVFPDVGGLDVRVSNSPLVEAQPGFDWLIDFQHACAEQVASQVLGVTASPRWAPETIAGLPRARWLAANVDRLLACQRSDGGFGFWPGSSPSAEYLSAYVGWALAEAQRAGSEIDSGRRDEAVRYLSALLRRGKFHTGEADGWLLKTVASFALVKLNHAEPAYFQALYDGRAGHPAWARALLAAAVLAADSGDARGATLVQEIVNQLAVEARTARLEEKAPAWAWWLWGSEARDSAAALLALATGAPTSPVVDRLARGLLDHIAHDRAPTTHSTAWMLQALGLYDRVQPGGATAAVTAAAELAGASVLRAQLSAAQPAASGRVTMDELVRRAQAAHGQPLPLVVSAEGGRVHGAATLSYAARAADRPALAQGLELERRFLDASEQPVARVRAGDEVTVVVVVNCPAVRRFVAVEAPLPAGLEAVDRALATSARPRSRPGDEVAEDEEEDSGDTYWWRPGFDHVELRDDRIVLYATELPAGTHIYKVRCRATTPGSFTVAAARAEEMYAPEVFGTTAGASFEVLAVGR